MPRNTEAGQGRAQERQLTTALNSHINESIIDLDIFTLHLMRGKIFPR
jgi:hypothetical protein